MICTIVGIFSKTTQASLTKHSLSRCNDDIASSGSETQHQHRLCRKNKLELDALHLKIGMVTLSHKTPTIQHS